MWDLLTVRKLQNDGGLVLQDRTLMSFLWTPEFEFGGRCESTKSITPTENSALDDELIHRLSVFQTVTTKTRSAFFVFSHSLWVWEFFGETKQTILI